MWFNGKQASLSNCINKFPLLNQNVIVHIAFHCYTYRIMIERRSTHAFGRLAQYTPASMQNKKNRKHLVLSPSNQMANHIKYKAISSQLDTRNAFTFKWRGWENIISNYMQKKIISFYFFLFRANQTNLE